MYRPTDQDACLNLISTGDLWQIRTSLSEAELFLKEQELSQDWIGEIILVLTEAMTNIVKHGELDAEGEIRLTLSVEDGQVTCVLMDTGRSFDPAALGHTLPDPSQLQEGGYGWFIIRKLSKCIHYSRENGRNCLSFALPLEGT